MLASHCSPSSGAFAAVLTCTINRCYSDFSARRQLRYCHDHNAAIRARQQRRSGLEQRSSLIRCCAMVARCQKKTSHLADKPIRPPVTWVNKHLLPDFDHTIFPGCPIAQMGFTHMRFLFWSSYFQHRWSRRARSGPDHAVFRSVSAVFTCTINRWGSH